MLYLVCYDIENDYLRLAFSKYLEKQGLERVQRSVFVGVLNKRSRQAIENWCVNSIDSSAKAHVMVVPLKNSNHEGHWYFGQSLDWDYISNNCETLLL